MSEVNDGEIVAGGVVRFARGVLRLWPDGRRSIGRRSKLKSCALTIGVLIGAVATVSAQPTPTELPTPFPYAECVVSASALGLSTIDAGVVGNINRRADFNPDFVFVDELGDKVSLAVTDSLAFSRVDCSRAIAAMTLTENGPRSVGLVNADAGSDVDYVVTGSSRTAVYFGDGLGGSDGGSGQSLGVSDGTALAVENIDGEAGDEVVVGTLGGNNVEIARPSTNSPPIQPLSVGARVKAVAAADVDGDGRKDVLALDRSNKIVVFLQNPMPDPTPEPTPPIPSENRPDLFLDGVTIFPTSPATVSFQTITAMAVADAPDIDGDSVPDIVIVGVNQDGGKLLVLYGVSAAAGDYSVSVGELLSTSGQTPTSVAIGHLNDDGFVDIAVVSEVPNVLALFAGVEPRGSDTAPRPDPERLSPIVLSETDNLGRAPTLVLLADVDFDGRLDIAVGRRTGDLEMFLSNSLPVSTFTPTSTETKTVAPTGTATPTSTPTATHSFTPTATPPTPPTRTNSPTRTTTPGLLEVRGGGCAAIVEPESGGAWPLFLVLLGMVAYRRWGMSDEDS